MTAGTTNYGDLLKLAKGGQCLTSRMTNQAMVWLDWMAGGGRCISEITTPPGSPSEDDAHLIATGGVNEWLGKDEQIALFKNGTWHYLVPNSGMRIWVNADPVIEWKVYSENVAWPGWRDVSFI